jgi:hypothetical protein
MNTTRDRAILAALEHITDILATFEDVVRSHITVNKRNILDANFDALRKNVEEIRDSIED